MKGTNAVAFGQVLDKNMMHSPSPGTMIHMNDVAKLHILALDPSVKGHQNFIAGSGGVAGQVWGDAIEIVNQQFPEAVEDKR